MLVLSKNHAELLYFIELMLPNLHSKTNVTRRKKLFTFQKFTKMKKNRFSHYVECLQGCLVRTTYLPYFCFAMDNVPTLLLSFYNFISLVLPWLTHFDPSHPPIHFVYPVK